MTAWAIEALLASAALIALVLALRAPVRRAFGPQVAYALWALPALRLLLPPLPASWTESAPLPLATAGEQVALLILPAPVPDAGAPILGMLLVAAWCVGGLAFLGFQLVAYARFVRRVAAGGRELGRVGRIALVVSAAVRNPLAFGIARPVVAVPGDFHARYGRAERELVLAHEVGHHRRGDIVANWAALLVLALHWFNPLAWVAFRAFRADQEMANDASVLAARSADERYAYACAIARAGGGSVPAAACELHNIKDLKGRLRMLKHTTSRGRRAAGAAAVAGVTLALLGVTASGGSAAETVRTTVERATGVPLAALGPSALLQTAEPAPVTEPSPPAPPGPTAPGSGGRHVHAVRDARGAHVTVTENGRTQHLSGKDAEAWLAAHPVPAHPAPPAPPAAPTPPEAAPLPPLPPLPPAAWNDAHAAAAAARGAAGAEMALRNMPRVVSRDCRTESGPTTMTRSEGGRRTTIICTNRIEAATRRAELAQVDAARLQRDALRTQVDATRIRRDAMAHALDSLRRSRETMANGQGLRGLSASERAEALRGIDESITELEREAADRD